MKLEQLALFTIKRNAACMTILHVESSSRKDPMQFGDRTGARRTGYSVIQVSNTSVAYLSGRGPDGGGFLIAREP